MFFFLFFFSEDPTIFPFNFPPRYVLMSVSKEYIQTLICDFACRNDSDDEKKKENLLVIFV